MMASFMRWARPVPPGRPGTPGRARSPGAGRCGPEPKVTISMTFSQLFPVPYWSTWAAKRASSSRSPRFQRDGMGPHVSEATATLDARPP